MPKKARTPEEIQSVKQRILDKALELINEDGYNNFSMRKLAGRLNMTATPIYGYYKNKDELYLSVLTQGFETLYNLLNAAYLCGEAPIEKLRKVVHAYIQFGLENANFYNIMLVLNVPKFYDYVGTANEEAASLQLQAAARVRDFGLRVIKESGLLKGRNEEEASMAAVELICSVHGFVSIVNSQISDYLALSEDNAVDQNAIERYINTVILEPDGAH